MGDEREGEVSLYAGLGSNLCISPIRRQLSPWVAGSGLKAAADTWQCYCKWHAGRRDPSAASPHPCSVESQRLHHTNL